MLSEREVFPPAYGPVSRRLIRFGLVSDRGVRNRIVRLRGRVQQRWMKWQDAVAGAAHAFREEDNAQSFIQSLVYLSDDSRDVLQFFAINEDRADAASEHPYGGPIRDVAPGNENVSQTCRISDDVYVT